MGYAILAEKDREMDARIRFHRFRYHLARGFISSDDIVLDLGCGTGYGTEILSEACQRIIAYDMEKSNIDYAELKHNWHEHIAYFNENIEQIEVPEADVAVSFEVIEHLYKPKEFIDKLKRKIQKYIIVSVPLGQELVWIDPPGEFQEKGDATHHSSFATPEEFKSLFINDTWREFWSFRDGVTFIAIFYRI